MGSIQASAEPKYGHRLLPSLVDELARDRPTELFALVPKSTTFSDGLQDVTYSTMANAVNSLALWLEKTLGKSTTFETIAYIGSFDLRYFILALAATKVGYKTLFPSPRNSVEATRSLFDKTKCRTLFTSSEVAVEQLVTKSGPRHLVLESLIELLFKSDVPSYPYGKTFDEADHDPFIVIHTSGSTGLPKPVVIYHGGLATVDGHHNLPSYDEGQAQVRAFGTRTRMLQTLPPFHVAGILCSLSIALYHEIIPVWPPAGRPISLDLFDDAVDNLRLDGCLVPPSLLEEVSQSQASLDRLRRLKYVGFGGGPLAASAGDIISQYTKPLNILGSSESGFLPVIEDKPEDWQYFYFDPKLKGFHFEQYEENLYEMIIVRHPYTDSFHSTWYTFPKEDHYVTHDLFHKHPSKENLWLYAGRSDDVIVLSNGEKLNPLAMQSTMLAHPDVSGVLILGQGRFEPAALVELRHGQPQSEQEREAFDKSFQPYIDQANENAPTYAKLLYDHIFFTKPEKPMVRADKGTIKRSATAKLYAKEVDEFYEQIGSTNASTTVKLDTKDTASLQSSLKLMLEDIGRLKDLKVDEDVFALGVNSLQVMTLMRHIKSSIAMQDSGAARGVSTRLIYSNPTISQLATAVQDLFHSHGDIHEDHESTRIAAMEKMVEEFSSGLPAPNTTSDKKGEDGDLTIVLTGSTGSLGSYILDDLLSRPEVKKIICLNRSSDARSRQRASHASRGLVTDMKGQVDFIRADLSKQNLGLDAETYTAIKNEASLIIHNQWQVDFNLALTSFKPHVAGVHNLITLSSQSPGVRPPIVFTSSIGTLGNWNAKHAGEKVPEHPFHDYSIPSATGYGESKYVSERILENAAQREAGVPSAVIRVGQLAGPVVKGGGVWNPWEWLPSLIKSSAHLHLLPSTLPGQDDCAWIPVDLAAACIVDLALSSPFPPGGSPHYTYNLTNPHPSSWSDLLPAVLAHFSSSSSATDTPDKQQVVSVVDFTTWLSALKSSAAGKDGGDVDNNPAVKLLDFYEGMAVGGGGEIVLETKETQGRSESLRGMEGVGAKWMGVWMAQWGW
ncbi:MAG: hypothetical protein Q9220_007714 [cf. Caloplaca sp. 1 TL-2023]